jgi:hypothetical protein
MSQNNFANWKYTRNFKKRHNMWTAEMSMRFKIVPEKKVAPPAPNTETSGRRTQSTYVGSVLRTVKMNKRRISSRLRMILHSLATKVPKILLYRAEDMFPALKTSVVSLFPSRM